jgi:hypothetical protein
MTIAPDKAQAPLRIYPNTMLSSARAFQRLQAVAGRRAQAVKYRGGIQHEQLPECRPFHVRAELPRPFPLEQRLRIPAAEGLDHDITYRVMLITSSVISFLTGMYHIPTFRAFGQLDGAAAVPPNLQQRPSAGRNHAR